MLDAGGLIQTRTVSGEQIEDAIRELAREYSEDFMVERYLGYADYTERKLRQFYFYMGLGRLKSGASLAPLEDAPADRGIATVFEKGYLCVKR